MEKEEIKQPSSSFSDTFLSKLKEQSFTIIILVGIMYYQNTLFTSQMNEYKKAIDAKEQLILKLTDEERQRLIEREKYLISQRDQFIDMLKEETALSRIK
jgi:low affinity Fe/Cu permease